jgi:hypothetical protein
MELFNLYKQVISKAPENSFFATCGFNICENDKKVNGKVLITGINPYGAENKEYEEGFYPNPFINKPILYYKKLFEFIPEHEKEKTAYLDLFPFFTPHQSILLKNIRKHLCFIGKVLAVTQKEIERINPCLWIVANKGSWAFIGAAKNAIWMGYDLQPINDEDLPERLRKFDIRVIKGFRTGAKANEDRIYWPEDGSCKLKGTIVLMYKHRRGLKKEETIKTEDYIELSRYAKDFKSRYL